MARSLIARFGSLRAIYSCSLENLRDALGGSGAPLAWLADAVAAARRLSEAALREAVQGKPVDTWSSDFRRYLAGRIGCRREESVLVLFFNGAGVYIGEDIYVGGRRSDCLIPLRRTVRRAFDLDAHMVVLAHNHPSGVARPSEGDITATRRFQQVIEPLEIRLEDHCVVAGSAVTSMRAMGLL